MQYKYCVLIQIASTEETKQTLTKWSMGKTENLLIKLEAQKLVRSKEEQKRREYEATA